MKDNLKPEDPGYTMLDRTFLIWADARKNISSGAAGMDSLHKFYLDVLYGNLINREHLERLSGNKMKIFILCGGFGTRLDYEGTLKAKPMVKIGNKPILMHIIENFCKQGFNNFIL